MRRWTPDEDELARELAADGYTLAEVGDELGKTEQAVKARFHRTGVVVGRHGPAPDQRAEADLMALLAAGCCPTAAALRMGKDRAWVCRVAKRLESLGLVRRTGYGRWTRWRVTKKWTDDVDVPDELAEWLARGDSNQQIAERVGRDRDTVAKWAADLRTDGTRPR